MRGWTRRLNISMFVLDVPEEVPVEFNEEEDDDDDNDNGNAVERADEVSTEAEKATVLKFFDPKSL
jgi:hypothetical protein